MPFSSATRSPVGEKGRVSEWGLYDYLAVLCSFSIFLALAFPSGKSNLRSVLASSKIPSDRTGRRRRTARQTEQRRAGSPLLVCSLAAIVRPAYLTISSISKSRKNQNLPARHPSTPSPTPTTSPALSCPSPKSPVTFDDPIAPSFQKCTSLPQIPVARTWMRHSVDFGMGMGTGERRRVWVGEVVRARLGLVAIVPFGCLDLVD